MLKGMVSVANGTLRTTSVLGLRLLVQATTLLIVARLLGPSLFGDFAGIASLAILLGSLSTVGTNLVLLGEISRDPARRDSVLTHAIPATLLAGSLLVVVFLVLLQRLFDIAELSLFAVAMIGSAEILLQPVLTLMVSEHHGNGRVVRSQLLVLTPMALRLAVAILIFITDAQAPFLAYAIGYASASSLALLVGALTIRPWWPSWRAWRLPSAGETRVNLGYAVSNLTRLAPGELDKTLALYLLPSGVSGVYAAGARIFGAVFVPITAMILSFMPQLFRDVHQERGRRLLGWMVGSATAYGLVLAVILWLGAPLASTLFGDEYKATEEVIRFLCLAAPALAMRLVAGNVLVAMERPWARVALEATGAVVLAIIALTLSGDAGPYGIAVAVVGAEWWMAFAGLALLGQSLSRRHE